MSSELETTVGGEEDQENLPTGLALTWRLHTEKREGTGRKSLNLADIVAAAIAIADEAGMGEVSMARVARRLGYSTMALYRHVPGKPELLELMFDAGVGVPDEDTVVPGDWRGSLGRMARQMSAMYRNRRWLLYIPISGQPVAPNNLRWLEVGLQALRDTPLAIEERAAIVATIASFVRGNERLLAEFGSGQPDGPAAMGFDAILRQYLSEDEYPESARAIQGGIFDDESFDGDWQFGLDRLLDGIQVLIDEREAINSTV